MRGAASPRSYLRPIAWTEVMEPAAKPVEGSSVDEAGRVEAPAERVVEHAVPRQPGVGAEVGIPEPAWTITVAEARVTRVTVTGAVVAVRVTASGVSVRLGQVRRPQAGPTI